MSNNHRADFRVLLFWRIRSQKRPIILTYKASLLVNLLNVKQSWSWFQSHCYSGAFAALHLKLPTKILNGQLTAEITITSEFLADVWEILILAQLQHSINTVDKISQKPARLPIYRRKLLCSCFWEVLLAALPSGRERVNTANQTSQKPARHPIYRRKWL